MSDTALQCFCGGTPKPTLGGKYVECDNAACPLFIHEFYPDNWNQIQLAVRAYAAAERQHIAEWLRQQAVTIEALNSPPNCCITTVVQTLHDAAGKIEGGEMSSE